MSESISFILPLSAGVLLGLIFFVGLWYTVRRGIVSRAPALWFLGSWVLRTTIVVGGLYFISNDDWHRMLAYLIGFFLARIVAVRLTRVPSNEATAIVDGGSS